MSGPSDLWAAPLRLTAVVVILLAAVPVAAATEQEQEIRAAYVVNILRLSHRKTTAVSGELNLCLIRPGKAEQPLHSLENSLIKTRRLKVRSVKKNDITGCEVLYVGDSSGLQNAISKAQSMDILTIGNDAEFLSVSGMVALVVENRRMVVEISKAALNQSSWAFSSHLLEIARVSQEGVQ